MNNSSILPSNHQDLMLAIVGLGYVGLPLAIEFSKTRSVVGFDIDHGRIEMLNSGEDQTGEVNNLDLVQSNSLFLTSEEKDLAQCTCFIITVPTPIDENKRPDLGCLVEASQLVARYLKVGDVVIYESTVYPGCTEEDCVPILESYSNLKFNEDFFCGYSPERINPGDKDRRLPDIIKVTSGSTLAVASLVDQLYRSIIVVGTHKAESIKIAEAAKVIENTQRDLNIALVNELAIIFRKIGIDTESVLRAAGSKWNFLPFEPGLVGGHCIGVDPYYLTHKAQSVGYHPDLILAGRRINDGMGQYVAIEFVKALACRNFDIAEAKVLVMGVTFKENCPDLRNTRVADLILELKQFKMDVEVYDPIADVSDAHRELGIELIREPKNSHYKGIIIAVPHNEFASMGSNTIVSFCVKGGVVFDIKNIFEVRDDIVRL